MLQLDSSLRVSRCHKQAEQQYAIAPLTSQNSRVLIRNTNPAQGFRKGQLRWTDTPATTTDFISNLDVSSLGPGLCFTYDVIHREFHFFISTSLVTLQSCHECVWQQFPVKCLQASETQGSDSTEYNKSKVVDARKSGLMRISRRLSCQC